MQFSASALSAVILATSALAAPQPSTTTEIQSIGQFATDLQIIQPQTTDIQKRAFSVGANVSLDVVAAIKGIADAVNTARDREAKVKAALYSAQYAGKGKYSVMVFNLRQNHFWKQQPDPSRTAFNTFEHGGRTFGVWAFEGSAIFVNEEDGGWKNWGYYGSTYRDGAEVIFRPL